MWVDLRAREVEREPADPVDDLVGGRVREAEDTVGEVEDLLHRVVVEGALPRHDGAVAHVPAVVLDVGLVLVGALHRDVQDAVAGEGRCDALERPAQVLVVEVVQRREREDHVVVLPVVVRERVGDLEDRLVDAAQVGERDQAPRGVDPLVEAAAQGDVDGVTAVTAADLEDVGRARAAREGERVVDLGDARSDRAHVRGDLGRRLVVDADGLGVGVGCLNGQNFLRIVGPLTPEGVKAGCVANGCSRCAHYSIND